MRTTALRQRLSPRIADAGRWQYWAFYNLNHEAQLLTYMKLSGLKTGLLMNFNVRKLKDGIRRFVL